MHSFIKKPPFFLGLLNTLGSLLVYFVFVGQPVWGTNDEVYMSGLAAGVWEGLSEPSCHLFYIHKYYSSILQLLYRWQIDVPWYGLSFIFFVALTIFVLNYSILRLQQEQRLFFLIVMATVGTILPSLWHLQHTIVAGLATIAGGLLVFSLFIKEPSSDTSFFIGISIAIGLLLLGSMIRFTSFLMVAALFTPFGIAFFFQTILSNQTGQSNLSIKKYLLVLILICSSVLGLRTLNQKEYEHFPDWKNWYALERAKAEFIDFEKIIYTNQTKKIFDSVGWSQTDFDMIKTWQYADPQRYPLEKFIRVINSHPYKSILEQILPGNFNLWKSKVEAMIKRTLSIWRLITLFPLVLIVALFQMHWRKSTLWYLCGIIIAAIIILLYLFFGLNRAPFRVLVLLWIGVLWITLLLATNFHSITISKKKQGPVKKSYFLIFAGLFLFSSIVDFDYARTITKKGLIAQQKLKERVREWNENIPQYSIIYNIGSSFPFESHLPLMSFDYLRSLEGFLTMGWINQSPLQRKNFTSLGLENDFYGSLAQKKNVYLVNREEMDRGKREEKILQDFYKENYNLNLVFIVDPDLPSLSRMIFQKN